MIVVAFGSNISGPWGAPQEAICKAIIEIDKLGIVVHKMSNLYTTKPYGGVTQSNFLNGIVLVSTSLSPTTLLQVFKKIEAQAGRRQARRWSSRPLDLDIVDYKGVICNWKDKHPLGWRRLVLPHPGAHKRAFVLQPLCDLAPSWHHPVFGATAPQLLKHASVRKAGSILGRIDSNCSSFSGAPPAPGDAKMADSANRTGIDIA